MMKLSLMTINMFSNILGKFQVDNDMEEFTETYEEMLDLVKDTGYEAIDVTINELIAFGAENILHMLKERGLKVSSFIYCDQFTAMDEEGFQTRVDNAKKAIDHTVTLGSNVAMIVPLAQDNILDYSREDLVKQLIRHWTPVVEYAKEKGIHVVIEDTPDLKIPLCTTEEVQAVLDGIPGIEIVYDSGNMILVDEDPIAYYDTFADNTGYVHLKDMRYADDSDMFVDTSKYGQKMTCAATGTGMLDFKTLLEHIKNHGYDGYMTVEFALGEDGDYRKTLIQSREYLEALL